jgi:hypothetical protein
MSSRMFYEFKAVLSAQGCSIRSSVSVDGGEAHEKRKQVLCLYPITLMPMTRLSSPSF